MSITRGKQGMSHYTEGVLQAYLDGEVAADTRAGVDAHVAGCSACADRLQELRQLNGTFAAALQLIDVEAIPAAAYAQLEFRARNRRWTERFAGSRAALTRAAALVLGVTLVAAAAVPASPLRGWLVRVWNSIATSNTESATQMPAGPTAVPAAPSPPNAFLFVPVDGRVRVTLTALASGTKVHVKLVDDERGKLESSGGRVITGTGRIELVGSDAGIVKISLPRGATEATVEVDGRVYVRKAGSELIFHGPNADALTPEVIFSVSRKP